MQIIWRTLPRLALPAAIGLGAAYLLTSFVPRPAPTLRPPEDLRAGGLGYSEESPVRAILERNVLNLESTPFMPLGQPLVPELAPLPAPPAPASKTDGPAAPAAQAPPQAAFAPLEPTVVPQGNGVVSASPPLSGGSKIQGQAVVPASPQAPQGAVPTGPAGQTVQSSGQSNVQGKAAPAQVPAPPKTPAQAALVGAGIEGFRLVGVIAGGDKPLAMLQVDGAAVSLRLGEQVRGWTLTSVESGQVVLRRGQELRRVALGGKQP